MMSVQYTKLSQVVTVHLSPIVVVWYGRTLYVLTEYCVVTSYDSLTK